MNFFEHQDRARRRTRLLVVLFGLALISIVAVVDLVVLVALGVRPEQSGALVFSLATLRENQWLLVWVSLLTLGVIGLASLLRILSLRGGGATVARGLGGVPVAAETTDPQLRRLRNVVEEMAIAAGMPVPRIFVLEQEEGINAFAAGYSPADAAVAVTRGALDNLTRAELQGVIGHELSHILNGDMRLNIRLMGILFGILVIAMIGRVLTSARPRGGANKGVAAAAVIGLALVATGYVGLFFGRLIQASVSRQREFLADASAVQFTREPAGIAGALKKIAALQAGSRLHGDTQEIAHMLFAAGLPRHWLATHPPLVERIRAIEPAFDPREIERLRLEPPPRQPIESAGLAAAAEPIAPAPRRDRVSPSGLDADTIIARIGRPETTQIRIAAALKQAIPAPLARAAYSTDWVVELICALLISPDAQVRDAQLLMIAEALGAASEQRVTLLWSAAPRLAAELRLPLLEIAFPTLLRRPAVELNRLLDLIERLIHADDRVEVFEYVLARLLGRQIRDALAPAETRGAGERRLTERAREARDLLVILTSHGSPDQQAARAAYAAGLAVLGIGVAEQEPIGARDWPQRLDLALARLDDLRLADKERLLRALLATARQAGVNQTEIELLRAIVAALHIPMPILD